MRILEVMQVTGQRIRRPATWGAILVFGLLWDLSRWGLSFMHPAPPELLAPFAWAFAFLALSPVPWQWTGDEKPLAAAWRGVLQAVPWNGVWVLLLLLLIGGLQSGSVGRGRGPTHGVSLHGSAEWPAWLPLHPRMLVVGVANLSFGVLLGWILAGKERAESAENAAVKAAMVARVQALQSQMNPHVLFNAISGLTEMVREDPAAAEKALVNLSGLLRSLLEHGARLLAPLSLERALVEQYLSLEQLRLGKRLRVEWQWDRTLEDREIPPLMVQPLVENAIKHGIAPHRGGGDLRICLRNADDALELEVANTGAPLQEGSPGGLGMKNLRERMALMGEPEEAFKLWREGEWTRALVRLEAREKRL